MVIFSELETFFKVSLPMYHFIALKQVDSTSAYLKKRSKTYLEPTFCIAAQQTQGYGQRQRQWLSNEDSLTFSLLCRFDVPLNELDGLSQMIALSLIDSLSDFFEDKLYLKWPNDIYSDSGKVAGLLIESVKYDDGSCWLVIGIGINTSFIELSSLNQKNSPPSIAAFLKKSSREGGENLFLLSLVTQLDRLSRNFNSTCFEKSLERYQKYDYFDLGQEVIVYDTGLSIYGRYKGLTQRGELLFESEGKLKTYRSGNVSIRAVSDIKV
ncbi:MAG: biotin--[acetyl-CoA-carboxylase] ligase [Thiomicrorhabdus sp.]|nr:biotin--[acetyl-CoA-carboxylase] ligase [Thiomicrorhabdus sp.]